MAYITPHDWTSEQATVALMDEISNNFRALFPVGCYTYLCRAASTVETLLDNCWLECNAVSVLRATYPDLNTLLSGLGYPFGTVDGTHMTLPDAQGRALVSQASGGHADVNALGDSDALTKASRTPKHGHAHALTGPSHTHSNGTLAISPNPHGHGTAVRGYSGVSEAGASYAAPAGLTSIDSTSLSITGATGSGGSGTVGGTIGTDTAGGPAFLVGGVLFIKAYA